MNFKQFLDAITTGIFRPITVLIISLAVLYFLWGVLKYIQSADNEEKRKEGTAMMTYGIIGLFVMVALWGLVNVLKNTFDLRYDDVISPPGLTTSSSNSSSAPLNSRTSPSPLDFPRNFDSPEY